MRLSFVFTCINAFFIVIGTLLYIINFKKLDANQMVQYVFLMAIAWGSQGIMQYYQEIYYNFDPLIGSWKVHNLPNKILIL